jgi:hypothetical protein
MPIRDFRRAAPLVFLSLSAAPIRPDPWANLPDPPLMQGRLHTVALAGDTAPAREQALAAGYAALNFSPNYPSRNA